MKSPPVWFVNALQAHDRNLRVRWSNERNKRGERNCWVVESKTARQGLFKPVILTKDEFGIKHEKPLPADSDRAIQYRDGFAPILYARVLTPFVIDAVKRADMSQYRNLAHYERELDSREKESESRADKAISDRNQDSARSLHDHLTVRGSKTPDFAGAKKSMGEDWFGGI